MILNNYVELVYSNINGFEPFQDPPKASWQLMLFTTKLLTNLGYSKSKIAHAMAIHRCTVERYRRYKKEFNQSDCLASMMTNQQFKDLTL